MEKNVCGLIFRKVRTFLKQILILNINYMIEILNTLMDFNCGWIKNLI